MKILVKANNWLGDAMMSLPTLHSLRKMYPKARIAVLTKEAFADLYEATPDVDEVLPYRRAKGARRVVRGFSLAKTIRKQKFDVAFLLPRSFSSAALTFLAQIPRRIGYLGEGRGTILTDALRREPELLRKHRVYYYHNLLSVLGTPPRLLPPQLVPPPAARDWAREMLSRVRPRIVLNPGAAYGAAKQWFPERFIEVAKRLKKKYRAELILVGGPSERPLAETILKGIGSGIQLAGQTTVVQLAAVLQQSDLLLTNDTGPMHVADAVGTPIVAVFGPTDWVTTPPFGKRHTVVRKEMDCSPCLKRSCPLGHHHCMKWIEPDEVFQACQKWIAA